MFAIWTELEIPTHSSTIYQIRVEFCYTGIGRGHGHGYCPYDT